MEREKERERGKVEGKYKCVCVCMGIPDKRFYGIPLSEDAHLQGCY